MAPNAGILANMYHVNGGYIGDLGRQNSEYDDTLAQSAEMTPMIHQKEISLLTTALCIILPGGLFILAGLALHRYFKG